MHNILCRLPLLLLSVALISCGGGGSDNKQTQDDNTTMLDCDAIKQSTTAASATEAIDILTEQSLNQFYFIHQNTTDNNASQADIALISRQTETGYRLVLPATPELLNNGGTIQLAVSHESTDQRCQLSPITIAALPATNEDIIETTLANAETMLKQYEAMLAFDPDTINDEDLQDPVLFSAALTHAYFFDADSEISIPYLRQQIANASAEDKQFLAKIIQQSGINTEFEEAIEEFEAAAGSFSPIQDTSTATRIPDTSTDIHPLSMSTDSCTNFFNDPSRYKVEIRDGLSLAVALELSKEAREQLARAAARAEATDQRNLFVNVTATAAAIIGGPISTVAAVASGLYGLANFTQEHSTNQLAKLLPSQITDSELQIIPKAQLPEDHTDKFNNPLWNFHVSARSEGLNLAKQIVDGGFSIVSAAPGLPTISGVSVTGLGIASGKVFSKADANPDCNLVIPATNWNNIRVHREELIDVKVTGDAFSELADRQLSPEILGSSELEVALKTDKFPTVNTNLAQMQDSKTLENLRKDYTTTSSKVFVDKPGAEVEIIFTSLNSAAPEAYQLDPGNNLNIIRDSISNNDIFVNVKTPALEESFPTSLTISSTSSELGPDTSARSKTVVIDISPINIELTTVREEQCNDGDYIGDFEATITGTQNDDSVTWSSTGGQLQSNGHVATLTTSNAGEYTITVRSVEDPEQSASVTVSARDCDAVMYISSEAKSNLSYPTVDSACEANNPAEYENTYTIGQGLEAESLTPKDIKQLQTPLSSLPINWLSRLVATTTSTVENESGCHLLQTSQRATNEGSFTATGDYSISINQDFSIEGACNFLPASTQGDEPTLICEYGTTSVVHQLFWIFDHQQASRYELSNSMRCNTPPAIPASLGIPNNNMHYFMLVFDQEGEQIVGTDFPTPWNPIHLTQCYNGETPLANVSWNIPDLPPGSEVVVMVVFTDVLIPPAREFTSAIQLDDTANSNGTITVEKN